MSIVLIDCNYMLKRAMFACGYPKKSYYADTEGVISFLMSLTNSLELLAARYCILFWDGGVSRRRMKIYPEYKLSRRKVQSTADGLLFREQLIEQIKIISEVTDALGLPWIQIRGREADDVIYLSSVIIKQNTDERVYIVSGDKDLLQAVDDGVFVYRPDKKAIVSPENFKDHTGIERKYFILARSLEGERSRNDIGGVPGVGKKTIEKVLSNPEINDFASLINFCSRSDASNKEQEIVNNFEIICRNMYLLDLSFEFQDEQSKSEVKRLLLRPRNTLHMQNICSILRQYKMHSVLENLHTYIAPIKALRNTTYMT